MSRRMILIAVVALCMGGLGAYLASRGAVGLTSTISVTRCQTINVGNLHDHVDASALEIHLNQPRKLRVAAFVDSADQMEVVGPLGWDCKASIGEDGGEILTIYPPGRGTSSPQVIVAMGEPASVGLQEAMACPLFASAEVVAFGPCPARNPRELDRALDPYVIRFVDPPHVRGTGQPSGGAYSARGEMIYGEPSHFGTWLLTCSLPATDAPVCDTIEAAFEESVAALSRLPATPPTTTTSTTTTTVPPPHWGSGYVLAPVGLVTVLRSGLSSVASGGLQIEVGRVGKVPGWYRYLIYSPSVGWGAGLAFESNGRWENISGPGSKYPPFNCDSSEPHYVPPSVVHAIGGSCSE